MENKLRSSETDSFSRHISLFNDTATKTKINRHLNDINDVISEEDIRNIKVTFPVSNNESSSKEKYPQTLTPWDLIDG